MAKAQARGKKPGGRKPQAAEGPGMSPTAFKRWRKSLGLSQKAAATALGLKRRAVQYYEKGERDGDPVEIPKTVRLACFALAQDCQDYGGPGDKPVSHRPAGEAGGTDAR